MLKQEKKNEGYRKTLATLEPPYMPIVEQVNSSSNTPLIKSLKVYFIQYIKKFNEFSKEVAHCDFLARRHDAQLGLKLNNEAEETKKEIAKSKKNIEKLSEELKKTKFKIYKMGAVDELLNIKKEYLDITQGFINSGKIPEHIKSFSPLGKSLICLSNDNVAMFTELYIVLFNSKGDSLKIVNYKELRVQSDYYTEVLPAGSSLSSSDEYAGTQWLYEKVNGGPDLRYSYNPSKTKVYRGRLKIYIEEGSIQIDYKTRSEAIKQREKIERYSSTLEGKSLKEFVYFVTKQEELCFDGGQLYAKFKALEKEKLEIERQAMLEKERIKREVEERKIAEEEKKKREAERERRLEEERRKREFAEIRRREEEKYQQELALRETKVKGNKEKTYNSLEEMPLYLMLNIDKPERLFTSSIKELGFNSRVMNALMTHNCNDVFSFLSLSLVELMGWPNLGKASVSEAIRLVELKYKGEATYVFNYSEKKLESERKRDSAHNKFVLTDDERRMIINARKEKELQEKKVEEQRKQKVFGENISSVLTAPIVQVGGTNEITNNLFRLSFRVVETIEADVINFVFVDDCGESVSNTTNVDGVSVSDTFNLSFELLPNKSFSSQKKYYLLIMKDNTDSIIGKLEYRINITFVSDFEF